MRGIIHLGDLRKGHQSELVSELDLIGYSVGPVLTRSACPPPELAVLGGDDQDWERLAPWLGECERLVRLDSHPRSLLEWIVPEEVWRPERVPEPAGRSPAAPGEWWCLEQLDLLRSLGAGLQGLHLLYKGQEYDLRSGAKESKIHDAKRHFGHFPEHKLAMDGWRCRYNWMWLGPDGPCDLASNAHSWPVGHAKKLYGYRDNDPVRGELSWDGQVCLSVYEVDALLSTAPFPWHEIIPGVVALVWPPIDSLHSVFYLLNPDYDQDEEEDVRDGPPALVLGPSPAQRYALALDRPVIRRWVGGHDRIDSGFEEYGVFDSAHSLVRTGKGRLLGGNAQRLVIWENGALLAEDFRGGKRSLFAFEAGEIEWALPVNGGWNLLLLRNQEEGPLCLRLV